MSISAALAYDPGKTSHKFICKSCPTEVVVVTHMDLLSPDVVRQAGKGLCYACLTKSDNTEKVISQ